MRETVFVESQVRDKFNRIAGTYAAKYEQPKTVLDYEKLRRMQLLLQYARALNAQTVLDVGCGNGWVLSNLQAQLSGVKLCGVDVSPAPAKAHRPSDR